MIRDAMFWEQATDAETQCELCPHLCLIGSNRAGLCGVRLNRNGKMILTAYGLVSRMETVEGRALPQFGAGPDTQWLSVGGIGCSMKCPFCNTWQVSQVAARTKQATPESLVQEAKDRGVYGLAFTYSEPLVCIEFLLDTFALAKKTGLHTLIVTNGMIRQNALRELTPLLDSAIVSMKGVDQERVMNEYGGWTEDIWACAEVLRLDGVNVEIAYLVVPGHSDQPAEFRAFVERLIKWDVSVRLHLVPCVPAYPWKVDALPMTRLHAMALSRRDKLKRVHVYGAE